MELTIDQLRDALNELQHLRTFRDQLQANNTDLVLRNRELEATLKRAAKFIYYAQFELEDGKATIGDQFPKKEDADAVMVAINELFKLDPNNRQWK